MGFFDPPKLKKIISLEAELAKNPDHTSNVTSIIETALEALEELGKYDTRYSVKAEEYIAKAVESIGRERRLTSSSKKLTERFASVYSKLGEIYKKLEGEEAEKERDKVKKGLVGMFADIHMALSEWGKATLRGPEFIERVEAEKWYKDFCKKFGLETTLT